MSGKRYQQGYFEFELFWVFGKQCNARDLDFRGKFFKPNLDKNSHNPRSTGNRHILLGVCLSPTPFPKFLISWGLLQDQDEQHCPHPAHAIYPPLRPGRYIANQTRGFYSYACKSIIGLFTAAIMQDYVEFCSFDINIGIGSSDCKLQRGEQGDMHGLLEVSLLMVFFGSPFRFKGFVLNACSFRTDVSSLEHIMHLLHCKFSLHVERTRSHRSNRAQSNENYCILLNCQGFFFLFFRGFPYQKINENV